MATKKAREYSKNYSKFVMGLLTNSDKMEKFRANAYAVAKAARLTLEEVKLILSGRGGAIFAGIDPSMYRNIRQFHVEVHVEITSSLHPITPPCCKPTWTSFPTAKSRKRRK